MPIPNRDILQLLKDANLDLANAQALDDLARRSGWSRFHLLREFYRVTGETPKQYMQRVRLDRAAAVLRTAERTILEIALEAGFQSHEVFTRAFRKQFGCSPSQYRKQSSTGEVEAGYATLVQSISPCVRLFHITEISDDRSERMKEIDISRLTLDQQPILFIRRTVDPSKLQPCLAECFGKLFGHGMRHGLSITGNPIARYVSIGPGLWTVDCILPLSLAADAVDDMQAGFLDGGLVLKAVHLGPYEALKESYVATQAWMEKAGLAPRSAHWEQYVTDPGEEPDPSRWQTDIYWPVK